MLHNLWGNLHSLNIQGLYIALKYTVTKDKKISNGLEYIGIYQLLIYADGINVFGENINTKTKNAKMLLHASTKAGLELNVGRWLKS